MSKSSKGPASPPPFGLSLKSPSRLFAIIICIDRYKASDKVPNLYGCVNDGREFQGFLKNKLNVPDSHICWCSDEEATYEKIMCLLTTAADDLTSLFARGSDFRSGDPIILFYAGHGGRSRAKPTSSSDILKMHATHDGNIELLCPHDIDTPGVDQKIIHGIPDFVFGNLLDTVAANYGGNVLAILDCCYSGGIARDSNGNKVVARGIDCEPIDYPILRNIRDKYPKAGGLRDGLRKTSKARLSLSFVLLAACGTREHAGEAPTAPDNKLRGIFTTALINVLNELQSYDLTYASLTGRVALAVAVRMEKNQTPEYVGDGNRILFKLDTTEGNVPFELEKGSAGLYIILKAGEPQGISKGTIFDVQSRDRHPAFIGSLKVVGPASDTDRGSSLAEPSFDPELDPGILWAFLHKLSYEQEPLKVGLGLGVGSFHPEQNAAIKETNVNAADIVLSKDGYWVLERRVPQVVRECSAHIQLPIDMTASHLNNVFAGIAHFNHHLMRTNRLLSNEAITIELYQVAMQSYDVFHLKDGNNLVKGEMAELIFDSYGEANYGFTLHNETATDWYPYLFHFDPDDYSIHQIYPAPKQRNYALLRAGFTFPIGHGDSPLKPTKFYLEHEDSAKGFLKLFLSKTKIFMDFIAQPSPFNSDFQRHICWADDDDDGLQWMEKMITVRIRRQGTGDA